MRNWFAHLKNRLFPPRTADKPRCPAEQRAILAEQYRQHGEHEKAIPPASRREVEGLRNRLEAARLRQQIQLAESVTDSIYGTPIPMEEIWGYRGSPVMPLWFRELYQTKATTLRYQQEFDRARNLARYAFETNPNAQGVINGLCAYVVGGGYDVSATAKEDHSQLGEQSQNEERRKLAARVQEILDEVVRVNELAQAADGCPIYDELFRRTHVEGEAFLRLFPDEWETTRLRFVEADNFRPPTGKNWEGPWSFGVLTSEFDPDGETNVAWDTSTPLGYNINYPLINVDEQVQPHFIFHLKANVKKNQKRGISSLYAVDEDLRGTQKLRYAGREGEKIRQSIAYIREHEQADAGAVQSLQSGNLTGVVNRTAQDGSQYQTSVQQIEPGTISDVPEGMVHKSPPNSGSAEALTRNLEAGLQTIAARFNAPSWLVSGASNDSSFAASLTSESPFLRTVLKQQNIQCGFWTKVLEAVVEIEISKGRLPENTLSIVHIAVTAHSPEMRKMLDEAQTNKILHDEGVVSLREWSSSAGKDFDEQQAQRKKEKELGIGQPQIVPGMNPNGQDPGGAPETMSGERQRLEGNRETREQTDGYIAAACAGYAIALAEATE